MNSTLSLALTAFTLLIGCPLAIWWLVSATNRRYLLKRNQSASKAPPKV